MSSTSIVPAPLLNVIQRQAGEVQIWLVGGALRDHFLDRPIHDMDLVVAAHPGRLARAMAKELGGAYYDLDPEREVGRIVRPTQLPGLRTLDLTRLHPEGIEADLRNRDFTINALALALPETGELIDPLEGLQDLKDGLLRLCAPDSIEADPLRSLRGVRLAVQYQLKMDRHTTSRMRAAQGSLAALSVERVRDELLRMLQPDTAGQAVRLLQHLGLVLALIPELEDLSKIAFPPPEGASRRRKHGEIASLQMDAWQHTLSVLDWLGVLIQLVSGEAMPDGLPNQLLAETQGLYGGRRSRLQRELQRQLSGDRSMSQLLLLAGLLQKSGGGSSAAESAQLAELRCRRLRLSNVEAQRVSGIIRHQTQLQGLMQREDCSPVDAYRFFRSAGAAGVPAILLSLADFLAGDAPPPMGEWRRRLGRAGELLDLYLSGDLRPKRLLRGDELVRALGIPPGPTVGELLERIREAQVAGSVKTREQAMHLAARLMGFQEPDGSQG